MARKESKKKWSEGYGEIKKRKGKKRREEQKKVKKTERQKGRKCEEK